MTPPLGFKARVGSLICTGRGVPDRVPEIHLLYDTFAGVYGQHTSQLLSHMPVSAEVGCWTERKTYYLPVRCTNHSATATGIIDDNNLLLGKIITQECIPVGCVPPALYHTWGSLSRGVSVQGGLCPGGSLFRDTPTPQGTLDQAARPCEQNE